MWTKSDFINKPNHIVQGHYPKFARSRRSRRLLNLLLQLCKLGIPFLVIEPVKKEYRSLLKRSPDLQIFTLGDEGTAPFRLNIFEPPPGVKVQKHLENLEAIWNASFAMQAPLPYVLKQVVAETYVRCGWDIEKNLRGRSITLEDFRFAADKVSVDLGYDREVTLNIGAALRNRIKSLALGGKGALLDTLSSLPVERILERPTVIELREIENREEKAFVAAVILNNIAEYIETRAPSGQLRHVTVIEEAHRLMPNISTQKGDPENADPRRHLVELISNLLAEVRAYEEGIVIVEQIPTKIIPDAIKNTGTKVAFRLPSALAYACPGRSTSGGT